MLELCALRLAEQVLTRNGEGDGVALRRRGVEAHSVETLLDDMAQVAFRGNGDSRERFEGSSEGRRRRRAVAALLPEGIFGRLERCPRWRQQPVSLHCVLGTQVVVKPGLLVSVLNKKKYCEWHNNRPNSY